MIPPKSNIYLETSAVNFLADKFSWRDGKATRIYHELKGSRFYISTVTIWEILLTADEERKDALIQYLQNITYYKLINSPSEFIISFLKSGCPLVEKSYDFHSKLQIAEVWNDLCENPLKSFVYNQENLKQRADKIREVFKHASKQLEDIVLLLPNEMAVSRDQILLDKYLRNLKEVDLSETDERERKLFKISLVLILIILCTGIEIDNTPINDFWESIGINKIEERLSYVLKHYETIVYRGPIAVASTMVLTQLEIGGKPTRGILWDALHSINLIYTDYFLTADEHFKKLKDKNDHLIYSRIIHLSDDPVFTARKIEIEDHKILQ
ncbi:MAG: hypothetical protein V4642_10185 [Bacteroidota bacterium]